jgi:hypothetical protein
MRKPWRGRLRRQVERAFEALAGQDVPIGTMVRWIWPRRGRFRGWHYERARRAATDLADVVGHVHRGRNSSETGGWLSRLREPAE